MIIFPVPGRQLMIKTWWRALIGEKGMTTNFQIQCIFQEIEHHKYEVFFQAIVGYSCLRVFLEKESCQEYIEISKDISLRLILRENGGNRHYFYLPLNIDSDLEIEIFSKKKESNSKRGRSNRGLRWYLSTLVLGFQKNFLRSLSTLLLFSW